MSLIPEGKLIYFLCRMAVHLLSLLLLFGTLIPLIRTDEWWIRVFDFPRMQIAVLIGFALAGYAILRLFDPLRPWEYGIAASVGLALLWQVYSILPYTVFYPHEMEGSRAKDDSNRVSLLIYNVLSENRQVEELRNLIRTKDPDMILLSEPNNWWLEQLAGLEADYRYTVFQPQENEYGMLLFSKLELMNPQIRFLIESEVPSLRTDVRLRSGKIITLFGIHPRPPGIKRNEDDEERGSEEDDDDTERVDSDMRDAELLLVAKEINQMGNVPVIVAGDFNDVAWSHTTHLFQRIGGLIDPRVGRGLYNSFDTKSSLLRYPLDHVFASQHFFLVELRRLPEIGSDHFPMFVVLDLDPKASLTNDEPEADAGDAEEAEEAIQEGKANN